MEALLTSQMNMTAYRVAGFFMTSVIKPMKAYVVQWVKHLDPRMVCEHLGVMWFSAKNGGILKCNLLLHYHDGEWEECSLSQP